MKFKLDYRRMDMQQRGSGVKWYVARAGKLVTMLVYGIDGGTWRFDVNCLGSQINGKRLYSERELAEERAVACARKLLAEAMADLESEVTE